MARDNPSRSLWATGAAYLVILGVLVTWHWSLGPPYERASSALIVSFGLAAALVSLLTLAVVVTSMHWLSRTSSFIAGSAVIGGLLLGPFDWPRFYAWQLLVMLVCQAGVLMTALAAARLGGYRFQQADARWSVDGEALEPRWSQHSLRDLVTLCVACAMLFAVLRFVRPVGLGTTLYWALAAGGAASAIVTLGAAWTALGAAWWPYRVLAALMVAPLGGAVYAIVERNMTLLFSWRWYSVVTTLQALFLIVPLGMLRARGFRFARKGDKECDP